MKDYKLYEWYEYIVLIDDRGNFQAVWTVVPSYTTTVIATKVGLCSGIFKTGLL